MFDELDEDDIARIQAGLFDDYADAEEAFRAAEAHDAHQAEFKLHGCSDLDCYHNNPPNEDIPF